jgi:hypothetical protein
MHMLQTLIVTLVVLACMASALWRFSPKTLRNRLLAGLRKLPGPQWLQARLQAAQNPQGSCGGCSGCAGTQACKPVVFHPRMVQKAGTEDVKY